MSTSEEDIRIDEFAGLTGYWMIYWVDKVALSEARSRTPKVQVHLVELDKPAYASDFAAIVRRQAARRETLALHVGLIPTLRIGAVYQDGIPRAPCFLSEAEISIPLDPEPRLMQVADEISYAPHFWNPAFRYRVLNRSEYVLLSAMNSNCIIVRSAGRLFVIPCFEILRVFYAQHSLVSNALFGSWEHCRDSVATPEKTFVRPDGSWQVYLTKHIGDDLAALIANLMLDPFGLKCAKSIFTSIQRSPFITARIPFNKGRLKVVAKVLPLQPDPPKFFVTELSRVKWPISMEAVHVDRENSNVVGEIQVPVDAPPPYGGEKPDDKPRPPVTSGDDPRNFGTLLPYVAPGVVWEEMPPKIRVPKDQSGIYVRPEEDKPARPTSAETSTGIAGPGLTQEATVDAGTARFTQRFRGLIDALKQLDATRQITSWRVVPPPAGVLGREGLACWPFPTGTEAIESKAIRTPKETRLLWSWINLARKIQRAALVCEAKVFGQTVVLVEIELRRRETGYKALFALGGGQALNLERLLLDTARSEGVWKGKPSDFGFVAWKPRRHHFPDDEKKITSEWVVQGITSLVGGSSRGRKPSDASNTKRSPNA